ncbi:MAG: tyrosine-type recombinase/integrase, partial [Planctomycetota bacterium]
MATHDLAPIDSLQTSTSQVGTIVGRMRSRIASRDPLARADDRRTESTRATYRADLRRFLAFAGADLGFTVDPSADPMKALAALVLIASEAEPTTGGRIVIEDSLAAWRDSMGERGLAPKSINRRLSAMRQALRGLARIPGATPEAFDPERVSVRGLEARTVRDTRGPSADTVATLLRSTLADQSARGRRDALALSLLCSLGLRRNEVATLRLGDIATEADRLVVRVLSKGSTHREEIPAPSALALIVQPWIAAYRELAAAQGLDLDEDAPLLPSIDRIGRVGVKALSGRSIATVLRSRGEAAGIFGVDLERLRPHGLRHRAISTVAKHAKNSSTLAAYTRHSDPRTTESYLDDREDSAL